MSCRLVEGLQRSESAPAKLGNLNLFYEEWIEHPDGKAKFNEIVECAVQELAKTLPRKASNQEEILISFRQETSSHSGPIWVGRHSDCDVRLDLPQYSRRQFVLVPFREFGILALIALGGHAVTEVIQRSNGKTDAPCATASRSNSVLVFDLDELVELRLSSTESMLINPKLCVVCLERARNVQLDCQHFVACSMCTAKLTECPLCRSAIQQPTQAFRFKTFG